MFGLGSSAYPNFCSFARFLDNVIGELGGERIYKFTTGDELCAQEQSFNEWAKNVFEVACNVFCIDDVLKLKDIIKSASLDKIQWSLQNIKLIPCPMPALNKTNEIKKCKFSCLCFLSSFNLILYF